MTLPRLLLAAFVFSVPPAGLAQAAAPPSAKSIPAGATYLRIPASGPLTLHQHHTIRQVTLARLPKVLSAEAGPVYLSARKNVTFGRVRAVIDALQHAGITNIAIVTS